MAIDINISIQPKNLKTVSEYNNWLNTKLESELIDEKNIHPTLKSFFKDAIDIIPPLIIEPNIEGYTVKENDFGGLYYFSQEVLSMTLKGSTSLKDEQFDKKMTDLDNLVSEHDLIQECDGDISGGNLIDDSAEAAKKEKEKDVITAEKVISAMPSISIKLIDFFAKKHPELSDLKIDLVQKDDYYLDLRIRVSVEDKDYKTAYSVFSNSVSDMKKIIKQYVRTDLRLQIERKSTNYNRLHVLWSSEKKSILKNIFSLLLD